MLMNEDEMDCAAPCNMTVGLRFDVRETQMSGDVVAFWDRRVLCVSDALYARKREAAIDATRWLVDQVVQLAFECMDPVATARSTC